MTTEALLAKRTKIRNEIAMLLDEQDYGGPDRSKEIEAFRVELRKVQDELECRLHSK